MDYTDVTAASRTSRRGLDAKARENTIIRKLQHYVDAEMDRQQVLLIEPEGGGMAFHIHNPTTGHRETFHTLRPFDPLNGKDVAERDELRAAAMEKARHDARKHLGSPAGTYDVWLGLKGDLKFSEADIKVAEQLGLLKPAEGGYMLYLDQIDRLYKQLSAGPKSDERIVR